MFLEARNPQRITPDAETFKATMTVIHDGAATLMDALDAAMTGEPQALVV